MDATNPDLEQAVKHQVDLLNSGRVLEALDLYFDEFGKMYENDNLFGNNKVECRRKQEPYINSAKEIIGHITHLKIVISSQVCVFRNQSTFFDQQDKEMQIDGLHWQQWKAGKIIEERYYHTEKMNEIISSGILDNPERLKGI